MKSKFENASPGRTAVALVSLLVLATAAGCGVAIPTRPDVNDTQTAPVAAATMNAGSAVEGGGGIEQQMPDSDPSPGPLSPGAIVTLEAPPPPAPTPAPWSHPGHRKHNKK